MQFVTIKAKQVGRYRSVMITKVKEKRVWELVLADKVKHMNWRMRGILFSAFLLVLSLCLLKVSKIGEFANWYAVTIYPVLVNTIGRCSSLFPVSLSEMLLYLFLVYIICDVLWIVKLILFKNGRARGRAADIAVRLLLIGSILLFLYTIACGINYNRDSFSSISELEVQVYTVDELLEVCEYLTELTNTYSLQVTRDTEANSVLLSDISKEAKEAMTSLGEIYPSLSGYYPNPKAVVVSQILSYQHLSGIYSPFTVEANYNGHMSDYNIPFTVCHELSHLKGFMREDEANYIAYLACMKSDEAEFNYSGALTAWIYCTNSLYKADKADYFDLYYALHEEVRQDLASNSQFWASYEGVTSEVAEKVNDTYLKVNNQTEGVMSYGRVVDLIIANYLVEKK